MTKVIVADDDDHIRTLLGTILGDRKGLEVILCSDGKELVEKVKEINGEVSMVLTDNNMPYMDGVDAAGILRHNLGYNFPIWLMTGRYTRDENEVIHIEKEVKLKGDRAGITGYLAKPFSLTEISAIIDSLQPSQEDSNANPQKQYSGD